MEILQQDVLGKSWESIRIKRPRGIKELPVVLSKEEIESLIETTRNGQFTPAECGQIIWRMQTIN